MLIRGRTQKLPKAKATIAILFCFTLLYQILMTELLVTEILKLNLGDERVLISADLNAHSRIWAYANEDTRGAQEEDFLLAQQLYLLNETNSPPTFRHCDRKGWPDLSFIKGTDFANSCTWNVLEDYTHNDHNYILIEALP
ncbi:hypothetical protein AVEN_245220-1 [Araneus ventricosus]|uniref:Endonuclease/exonuclease/phosphatase domain-containing protein n=1 Tax=Araneus ventricosus TaxID=182803 RepID=A0A4Y2VVP3_ARAVE|nr:hypothetical protein AVEN_245220-1 [Araneus ventricosus]